jgi:N utilization substance protein A
VKLFLDKVIKTTKGPKLLISRTHPKLVQKLLELEIPEVTQGIVSVNAIARDPGVRCKIAVSSSDSKIDPIGACVGQKGVRIQALMDELNGERIDVINFNENKVQFLKVALAPAKVAFIDLNEENMTAKVYVEEDQRPLAIGRSGQNVRLASKLVGLEIDILDLNLFYKKTEKEIEEIFSLLEPNTKELESITKKIQKLLENKIKNIDMITELFRRRIDIFSHWERVAMLYLRETNLDENEKKFISLIIKTYLSEMNTNTKEFSTVSFLPTEKETNYIH